jgi:aspartate-semialdehyde dehydrogenase
LSGCRIAVIGATGAVGQVFLEVLEARQFPVESIRLCASERSVGKKLKVFGEEVPVELVRKKLLRQSDIVFISASGDVSREVAPTAVERGAVVIDDSSAFRMHARVPLVVPEVNAADLESHIGIISIPNCSTTPLVMVLKPLEKLSRVRRVVVDTYQSVSGTGAAAVRELDDQNRDHLEGREPSAPEQYPHQIAYNLLPHIEPFLSNGYTKEEMKMVEETRKILHRPDLDVSATCVRVPVRVGHSLSAHIEFEDEVSPGDVREALTASDGVTILDDPRANVYPTPLSAAGKDDVFVGRIRRDASHPRGIAMWIVSDNLRKGAATNAIQIAEEVLERDLLLKDQRRQPLWQTSDA